MKLLRGPLAGNHCVEQHEWNDPEEERHIYERNPRDLKTRHRDSLVTQCLAKLSELEISKHHSKVKKTSGCLKLMLKRFGRKKCVGNSIFGITCRDALLFIYKL